MNKILTLATVLMLAATAAPACNFVCFDIFDNDDAEVEDRRTSVGPTTRLEPNAYGMGTSSDQYGRAVKTHPLWDGEDEGLFAPNGFVNIWN